MSFTLCSAPLFTVHESSNLQLLCGALKIFAGVDANRRETKLPTVGCAPD